MLAFTLAGTKVDEPALHVMLNMGESPEDFAVPELPGIGWGLAIDTTREPWFFDPLDGSSEVRNRYRLPERAVVVLEGRR
jgi:hypothetical protein